MANTDLSFIDKLVDNEGVKVNVTANLAPEIYIKLFFTIVASVLISVAAANLINNVLKE